MKVLQYQGIVVSECLVSGYSHPFQLSPSTKTGHYFGLNSSTSQRHSGAFPHPSVPCRLGNTPAAEKRGSSSHKAISTFQRIRSHPDRPQPSNKTGHSPATAHRHIENRHIENRHIENRHIATSFTSTNSSSGGSSPTFPVRRKPFLSRKVMEGVLSRWVYASIDWRWRWWKP